MTDRRALLVLAFALELALAARPAAAAVIADPGFGAFPFAGGPGELSGLTHVGDDDYLAVSDSGGQLAPIAIEVDPDSGAVLGALVAAPVALAGGVDLEGVAYDAERAEVWVTDEVGPAIRAHDPATGEQTDAVAVPALYAQARANRSLESLARDPVTGELWTANEEALAPDGPVSSFADGTLVRIQRFDTGLAAAGQWAYRTDPIPHDPAAGNETSGVVDLLVLPSGELLVLERSLSSQAFRSRLYQVDFTEATDTSALASLDVDPFVPLGKTLLWEAPIVYSNFEGVSLGPRLQAGDWSLLLVADDAGAFGQALYPLRVSFVPEPGSAALLAVGAALLALRNRRR